jgi:methyl-accepting chemotaxis protein
VTPPEFRAERFKSHGIDQVNRAVGQMERTTQTNAVRTQEVSTTAGGLTAEAEELRALVARFKVEAARRVDPSARPITDGGAPSRPAPRRKVRAAEPTLMGVSSSAFDRL